MDVCVNETNGEICDKNESLFNSVTNKPTEVPSVSESIREMIGAMNEKVTRLEEIVKKEIEEPSSSSSKESSVTSETNTKPRVVEIRREIKPLPLPPSFFEKALTNDMDDHMFVRGVPRTRSSTNHTFTRIVSRFNSTETQSTIVSTSSEKPKRNNFKFSSLKSSLFGKSFDNDDGDIDATRNPNAPWSASCTSKRMKFRISSLSRDVPLEAPDLHTGFIMDETLKIEDGKGITKGRSLLQFLEKCIVKNQN